MTLLVRVQGDILYWIDLLPNTELELIGYNDPVKLELDPNCTHESKRLKISVMQPHNP